MTVRQIRIGIIGARPCAKLRVQMRVNAPITAPTMPAPWSGRYQPIA
jgi:hypothetical protein